MLLCGIHDGHNAAAALVEDGRVIAALQEERVGRVKNWHGFPEKSVDTLLEHVGKTWTDVDRFLLGGKEYYHPPGGKPGDREAVIRSYSDNIDLTGRIKRWLRNTPLRTYVHQTRNRQRQQLLLDRGVSPDKIETIEHHRCHAAAAYYGMGMDKEALVITVDGAGDGLCATVSIPGEGGELERLASVDEEHSIGILWCLITAYMGMVPNEHEYKMMGMAPYSNTKYSNECSRIFASSYQLTKDGWMRTNGLPEASYAYGFWKKQLEFQRFDNVCGGLQVFTEEFLSGWIASWLKETGRTRLRLAGGVFMNVKLNQLVMELEHCDDVKIFPSCGDETNSMGACWEYLAQHGAADTIEPIESFFLGTPPSDEAYLQAVELARENGFDVKEPADIEEAVASLLASGNVVARFFGREEFGARALGNRSILADPASREVVRTINKAIKSRDFWMPFACSILDEAQEEYLVNPKNVAAPYMILTFDSRNTDQIIAGCHPEDGTIRPQIVKQSWNPEYHRLLTLFRSMTGRGALLNTSFNLHGEPIVSSPEQAIDVMTRSGLTHLALGRFLISKSTANER